VHVTVAVHEGLLAEGEGGPRLLGSRCRVCRGHHFPRHQVCPYCSSEEVEPVELSPAGVLWTWTAVTAPPPGYQGEVPYGFGVVELPEGLRVVTRLTEPDPTRLHAGQRMRLVTDPLHVDGEGRQVVTYAFAPEDGG
jgi:uncharacterized OB-fold protein